MQFSFTLLRAGILVLTILLPACVEAAERWAFSLSGYGGNAYPSNEDVDINCGPTCSSGVPFRGTIHGVQLNDSATWGAKATAWFLPRAYSWSPQFGVELDWTRFTPNMDSQTQGASGTVPVPGFSLSSVSSPGMSLSTNIMAINVVFRYPIGANEQWPEGRWGPYFGLGGGVQRTHVTPLPAVGTPETDYAPEYQGLVGLKVFLFRNLALFGEWKHTHATHRFTYGNDSSVLEEKFTIAANHLVAGLSLHF
jgi:hypothetical protein